MNLYKYSDVLAAAETANEVGSGGITTLPQSLWKQAVYKNVRKKIPALLVIKDTLLLKQYRRVSDTLKKPLRLKGIGIVKSLLYHK